MYSINLFLFRSRTRLSLLLHHRPPLGAPHCDQSPFARIWARDQHRVFSEYLPGCHSQNPPRSFNVSSHSRKVSGIKITGFLTVFIWSSSSDRSRIPSESAPLASELSSSTTKCAYQDSFHVYLLDSDRIFEHSIFTESFHDVFSDVHADRYWLQSAVARSIASSHEDPHKVVSIPSRSD